MASLADARMAQPGRPGRPGNAPVPADPAGFAFLYRPVGAASRGGPVSGFTAAFDATGAPEVPAGAFGGPAAFVADVAYGLVPLETLAVMIGRFALAAGAAPDGASITLAGGGLRASRRILRRDLTVEETGFGAAHVLYEEAGIGCYILEIAPGHSIPAHCHRVMREWELILDGGLLQQGRPVARGAAFAWPLDQVHAYRNPTARPLRILCIDSPRFDPADERPLEPAPPLVPLAPFATYPV